MTLTPDRRTLVRAGLWTVPAVTLATAAPAFASSGGADLSTSVPGTPTRSDGDGWARVLLPTPLLRNTGDNDVSDFLLSVSFSTAILDSQSIATTPDGESFNPFGMPDFKSIEDPDLGVVGYSHSLPSSHIGGDLVAGASGHLGFDLDCFLDAAASQDITFTLTIASAAGGVPFVHRDTLKGYAS